MKTPPTSTAIPAILAGLSLSMMPASGAPSDEAAALREEIRQLNARLEAKKHRLDELEGRGTADASTGTASTPPPAGEGKPTGEPNATEPDSGKKPGGLGEWLKNSGLSLRQGLEDKNAIAKPAQFTMTMPKGGEDTYLVDAGLTWTFTETPALSEVLTLPNGAIEGSLFTEYHRNSDVAAEKNTFLLGGNASMILGDVTEDYWIHQFDFTAAYKRDRVKGGRGALVQIAYWPAVSRKDVEDSGSFTLGGAFGPDWMPVVIQPGIAAQFEDSNNVDKLGRGGETWRAKGTIEVAFYPFADFLNASDPSKIGPLEVLFSYRYWWNAAADGGFSTRDSSHETFKASINYYFGPYNGDLSIRPFAIGVDYVDGENPEEGYKDEDFWTMGFKAMF